MSTDEFLVVLERFNDTLPAKRDELILLAIHDINAIAQRRIIGSRANATGTIFGIYSPAYLKKRIKSGKGADPRINFSFTGEMWKTTKPRIIQTSDDQVTVRVQPAREDRKEVMAIHDERFGEILALSDEETDLLIEFFIEGVQEHLDNHFTFFT